MYIIFVLCFEARHSFSEEHNITRHLKYIILAEVIQLPVRNAATGRFSFK